MIKLSVCLLLSFLAMQLQAQIYGCTDAAASNYNDSATLNDGSCTYTNATVKPSLNAKLSSAVNETSGLIFFNKNLFTHNDSGGQPELYSINSSTGAILKTVTINNATNVDWEDIAQDETYIYIGDFGNNASGNRKDLVIYKVKKKDVRNSSSASASAIHFSYSDQTDFTPKNSNSTNFDCEALIAFGDSLYLFSKDWLDNKTRLYKLPKTAGTYTAEKTDDLDVQGLITGADVIVDKRVIILSGYSALLEPFVYLLYDFSGSRFFNANKRKINVQAGFLQMEGICAKTNTQFYVSNERTKQGFITTPAKLQTLNMAAFLNPYYTANATFKKGNNIISYSR